MRVGEADPGCFFETQQNSTSLQQFYREQWPENTPWDEGRDISSTCMLLNERVFDGGARRFTAAFVCPLSGIQFLCPGGGKATFNDDSAVLHDGFFWHSTPELARSAAIWFANYLLWKDGIKGPRIGGHLPRDRKTQRVLIRR